MSVDTHHERRTAVTSQQPTAPVEPTTGIAPGASGSSVARRPRRFRPSWRGWLGLVLPVLLLLTWQLVTTSGRVSPSVLPPPVDVLGEARRLIENGDLWPTIGISVQRVLLGFGIGAALAVVTGIAVGLSRVVDALLSPVLVAVRAVPSLAWVPLLILWAGFGELPKVTLVAIGAFFPVLATLVAGIRQVDLGLLEVARAYGLSWRQRVTTVLLPSAAPSLLAGARLGLAQAWLFLVAAELIASSQGLGFLLVDSQNTGRVDGILLAIVLLAVIGKLSDVVLALVEKRVLARLR
ncbi:ABC transporter permease [Aquipuribacter nitratireducens]|uniref:ABC transporter permease n=1 Tax=Aquipuribacter nitratireducens TaxID=650104 RepID=A0ABW0GLL2_9MICO